ncbi:MAG: Hpt domain-containing protein [Phycisphaerales bacterium]
MGTSDGTGGFGSDGIMLELFGAEVDMHLPVLSEGLLALEKGRAGKKEIDSMMRAAHSIKGAARIVGNDAAVRVAHLLEDCFTFAKEGRIGLSSDVVDTLLQGVDTLQRVCSLQSDLSEENLQSILDRIAAVRDGTSRSPAPTTARPADALASTSRTAEATVVLPAIFDEASAESVRRDLCGVVARTPSRILVDFGSVERVSAAGLSLLLSFAHEAKGAQPAPAVEAVRVGPPIRALFRLVGLDRAWASHD